MKVKEAMHLGVEWREPTTPVADIAKTMKDEDVGAIPIGENDRLIGMVTDRDITVRGVADGGDLRQKTARDVMTKELVYCTETDDIENAVRIMETKKLRRLPVLNTEKRLVGMLSLGDVSSAAPQSLTGELMQAVATHH